MEELDISYKYYILRIKIIRHDQEINKIYLYSILKAVYLQFDGYIKKKSHPF